MPAPPAAAARRLPTGADARRPGRPAWASFFLSGALSGSRDKRMFHVKHVVAARGRDGRARGRGGRWGGTMRGARWGDRGDRERYARVRGVRRCGDMCGGGCRSEGAWARVRGAWRRAEAWCVRMWGARRVRAGGVRRARAGARHVGLRGDVMRGAAGRARERGRGLAACAAAASRGAARGAARRRGTCRRGAREGTRGTGESRRLGAPAVARGGRARDWFWARTPGAPGPSALRAREGACGRRLAQGAVRLRHAYECFT